MIRQQTTGSDGYASTSGSASTTDISIDSFLNVPLYTNPMTGSGAGILGANTRPPAASSIAWFKQRQYFGRTTFQQQMEIQIIGTGTGGVAGGDTITIGSLQLVGVATSGGVVGSPAVPAASGSTVFFDVATGLTASNNIEQTARSLANNINRWSQTYASTHGIPPSRRIYAYYASSGVNDFGRIVIMRPVPSPLTDDPGIAFSVTTSSAGIRFPGGSTTSTDSYAPGGLSWSTFNEPESVPAVNFAFVGDPQKSILGFAVLRDAMLIIKEQEGVYILYDTGAPQPTINCWTRPPSASPRSRSPS